MASFTLATGVMAPLLIWMLLGYLLRQALNLSDAWVRVSNNLVFYLLLPLMLMRSIMGSDLAALWAGGAGGVIGFVAVAVLVIFGALMLIVPRLVKENARRGVIVQGIVRSNLALFGLPVAVMVYGAAQAGIVALLMAVVIPLFNILCVVMLEVFRQQRVQWGSILKRIATNPLIIAALLGLVLSLLHFQLPAPLQTAAWSLADCATPLSFIALGAGFSFISAGQNRKALTAVTLARLVLVPLVWVGLAALLGFRGQALFGVLVVTAPPTAVSSYPMACAMGGDEHLAGEIVVFTSVASIVTMFLWIFALSSLALI